MSDVNYHTLDDQGFSDYLNRRRRAAGMTMRDLTAASGVSHSTIVRASNARPTHRSTRTRLIQAIDEHAGAEPPAPAQPAAPPDTADTLAAALRKLTPEDRALILAFAARLSAA